MLDSAELHGLERHPEPPLRARIANAATFALRNARFFVEAATWFDPQSHDTLAMQLQRHALTRPHQLFLRYQTRVFTYRDANAAINRHAHAYRSLGVNKGDVVALMLENRPEFLWHFFGLLKLGAIASLINTNLSLESVLHALRVCRPKRATFGSEVWARVGSATGEIARIAEGIDIDLDPEHPIHEELPTFGSLLEHASAADPVTRDAPRLQDAAAYIYTSGTTGMPKAAIIRHDRFYRAGRLWASGAFRFGSADICYNCLPLYHSNGLMLATGSVITAGVGMCLARRFSRARFWEDVRESGATAFIYIGEMCRYLLSAPASPLDRDHRVRVISGNGLHADIWREFQRRFGIERIAEFYGATEGNCITFNPGHAVGSCGPKLRGMTLARYDAATRELLRDARGFLIPAAVDEPGVLLCQVRRSRRFEGYTDPEASERKLIRGAFAPGDTWFNTGDVLRRDRLYRLYFVDRLGDTFRWKGENVATQEVEAALNSVPGIAQSAVYGVAIPGTEGRAGMASVMLHERGSFDPQALFRHVTTRLPRYAQPLLVRVKAELETTSTMKLNKIELQREGFDPAAIADPLWFLDRVRGCYVALTPELHKAIVAGAIPL